MTTNPRKVFLVPSDMMNSLRNQQRTEEIIHPLSKVTENLDQTMNEVLHKSNLSDREKVNLYNQLLLQLQHHLQDNTSHLPTSTNTFRENNLAKGNTPKEMDPNIPNEDQGHSLPSTSYSTPAQENIKENVWHDQIVSSVPQIYKRTTKSFLNYLKNNGGTWKDDGSISIQNKMYPGSNIIDIVNHSMRFRKNAPTPQGSIPLMQYLKKINVPKEFIGNQYLWDSARVETPPTPPHTPYLYKKGKGSSKRSAKVAAADKIKKWIQY